MNPTDKTDLQKLDCNCNDCKFMVRDIQKFNDREQIAKKLQEEFFHICIKNALIRILDKRYDDVREELRKEILARKCVFVKNSTNYGFCSKFNKEISFWPNLLQLETQECFKHRKDLD